MNAGFITLPQEQAPDENLSQNLSAQQPLTMWDRAKVSAQDALEHIPTAELLSTANVLDAKNGQGDYAAYRDYSEVLPPKPPNPVLSPEDIKQQYNLDVKDAMPQQAAALISQNQQRDLQNQKLLSEGNPHGFATGAQDFAVNSAAFMVDPANIALTMLPVVGEARVASLTKFLGGDLAAKVLARGAEGIAEGAKFGLANEAADVTYKNQNQEDWSANEALQGVLTQTLLGGAMHLGGHAAFGDFFSDGTKMNMARAAIAQDLNGKAPNAEAIANLDPNAVALDSMHNSGEPMTMPERQAALSDLEKQLSPEELKAYQELHPPADPEQVQESRLDQFKQDNSVPDALKNQLSPEELQAYQDFKSQTPLEFKAEDPEGQIAEINNAFDKMKEDRPDLAEQIDQDKTETMDDAANKQKAYEQGIKCIAELA